ncbi:MAG: hypothetical protein KDA61_03125 [Planctomycetales bacterium]|nr:hypothetical protein [Planctomycetales bacterium]
MKAPWGALCATLALWAGAQFSQAALLGLGNPVTVDGDLNVVAITVPSLRGGKAFAELVTADRAQILTTNNNTGGTANPVPFDPSVAGHGNVLDLSLPASTFIAGNGYGYVDLTMWGGSTLTKARDGDASTQDFVLFELGGNDDFSLAAILADGSVGERIYIGRNEFGLTNYVGLSQPVGMIAFDVADLLDGAGANLDATAIIQGVRVFEHQGDPSVINQRLDLITVIADLEAVPEPATLSLVLATLSAVPGLRRRRS